MAASPHIYSPAPAPTPARDPEAPLEGEGRSGSSKNSVLSHLASIFSFAFFLIIRRMGENKRLATILPHIFMYPASIPFGYRENETDGVLARVEQEWGGGGATAQDWG